MLQFQEGWYSWNEKKTLWDYELTDPPRGKEVGGVRKLLAHVF